jgi:pimeloyl-ACP methyl ester carboxylesterase
MSHTHHDAPTLRVRGGEHAYAYREIGEGRPLVLLNRFRGTIDDWDPLLNDLLAKERKVVIFDNAGVGLTPGLVPGTVAEMAADAACFIEALYGEPVDILGFSLGGYVAQALVLRRPDLVRKLVLAGTGPGIGTPETQPSATITPFTTRPHIGEEALLALFFTDSSASRAAGHAHWLRINERTSDRAPEVCQEAAAQQARAIALWRDGVGTAYPQLHSISRPVLIANGSDDRMVPTINSWLAFQRIPGAELIVYPDSGHGFHYQYPHLFAADAARFLDKDWYDQ